MKNRSEHYGDIKLWIEKIINSCENMDHIKTTDRLIINFDKKLESSFVEEYWREYFYSIIQPLKNLLENKRDEIFNKKLEL
jgi:hypothetical protein